ncbi:hypothetical protein T05_891 [Trichinella murrelli]|uniref:Uncharacterized protein n=1 Tax=Trichinella murrelli TaxID=144512 RepID=A0A0V0U988_9BILA|nr:hypothetical protein T05_891 [Trichinella murrelli]
MDGGSEMFREFLHRQCDDVQLSVGKDRTSEGRWSVTWTVVVEARLHWRGKNGGAVLCAVRVDDWIGKVERLDEQRRKFLTRSRSNCLTDRRSVKNTLTLEGGTICQPTRVGQGRGTVPFDDIATTANTHLNQLPQQATTEAERQIQQQQQQQHEVDDNFVAVHIPSYRSSEENTGTVGIRSEGHTAQKVERDSETVPSGMEKLGKLRKTGRPPYPVCTEVAQAVLGDQFIVPWTRQPGKAALHWLFVDGIVGESKSVEKEKDTLGAFPAQPRFSFCHFDKRSFCQLRPKYSLMTKAHVHQDWMLIVTVHKMVNTAMRHGRQC